MDVSALFAGKKEGGPVDIGGVSDEAKLAVLEEIQKLMEKLDAGSLQKPKVEVEVEKEEPEGEGESMAGESDDESKLKALAKKE